MTDPRTKRLPQDVAVDAAQNGEPDLSDFRESVDTYADLHAGALSRDDFASRVEACWGLVARDTTSLVWVSRELDSNDDDRIADAGGVLWWIGAPRDWLPRLHRQADALPEGEPADVLLSVIEKLEGPEPSDPAATPSDLLLNGERMPFTQDVWFVEAPLKSVIRSLKAWASDHRHSFDFTRVRGTLPSNLERLEPVSWPSTRDLFLETDSRWTAMFAQGSDSGGVRVVAIREGWRQLHVGHSPHVVRDRRIVNYGSTRFALAQGQQPIRHIQVSFQSRWEFDVLGDPLPFEETQQYEAQPIRDRFTLPMLNRYCASLGIRLPDLGFYGTRGVLVHDDISGWRRPPRMESGAEWRAKLQ